MIACFASSVTGESDAAQSLVTSFDAVVRGDGAFLKLRQFFLSGGQRRRSGVVPLILVVAFQRYVLGRRAVQLLLYRRRAELLLESGFSRGVEHLLPDRRGVRGPGDEQPVVAGVRRLGV